MLADEGGHSIELAARKPPVSWRRTGSRQNLARSRRAPLGRAAARPGHWRRRKTGTGLAGARSSCRTMASRTSRRPWRLGARYVGPDGRTRTSRRTVSPPNAQVQMQRIQIRVAAKPQQFNSDALTASAFVR